MSIFQPPIDLNKLIKDIYGVQPLPPGAKIEYTMDRDEQVERKRKKMAEHHARHKYCPECGNNENVFRTCAPTPTDFDTNDANCRNCGWQGKVVDLTEVAVDNCDRCNKKPAEELHTCPFAEEIADDFESLCNCCDDCTHECCLDI